MRFDLQDTRQAMQNFPPRRDGQTVFPDVDTVKAEVKRVKLAREDAEKQERERFEYEDLKRRRQENPDEFKASEEVKAEIARVSERFGMSRERPKLEMPKQTALICCPACDTKLPVAAGIRLMTPAELREWADIFEQREAEIQRQKVERQRVASEIIARDLSELARNKSRARREVTSELMSWRRLT